MFTKLFSSIIYSSVWQESESTRLVWITLLALADKKGFVHASEPGLAFAARVKLEQCQEALGKFLGPDPQSTNPENEGRRIEKVAGGWRLLNYEIYRGLRDEESRRAYKTKWQRDHRAAEKEAPETAKRVKKIMRGSGTLAERLKDQAAKNGDLETQKRLEEIEQKENPAAAEFRETFQRNVALAQAEAALQKAAGGVLPVKEDPEEVPEVPAPRPEGVRPGETFPEV